MLRIIGHKLQGETNSWVVEDSDNKYMTFDKTVVLSYLASIPKIEADQLDFISSVDEIELEKYRYDKRTKDGCDAYLTLIAELRIYALENNQDRSVNKEIERRLEMVKSQVCMGQWISAKEYLQEVEISGPLTQELWNRINNTLTNYITTNY